MKLRHAALAAARALGRALHVALRVAGWLFVIAVLTLGGLGVYAYRRFSPEETRRLAAEQLSTLLRREVVVERLLLSPSGIKVLGLRVRRGGSQPDVLSCGSALVTLKLKPLLDRRLEIETVRLESPRIDLIRDASGRWDVEDIFSQHASSNPASGIAAQALATARVSAVDGRLTIDDRLRRRTIELDDLSVEFTEFSPDKPFPARASLLTRVPLAGRDVDVEASGEGTVDLADFELSSATARIARMSARVAGVPVSGSGDLNDFIDLRIRGELRTPELSSSQLQALFSKKLPLSVPAARWSFRGGLPAAGMLDVQSLRGQSAEGSVSASGVFDFAADTPTLSAEVSFAGVPLERAAQRWTPWAGLGLRGRADLDLDATGWAGRLQAREARLSLRGFSIAKGARAIEDADIDASASDEFSRLTATIARGRLRALGRVAEDISGSAAIDGRRLTLDKLAFRLEGSRVSLRARMDRFFDRAGARVSAPKEVLLSASVDKIDWLKAAQLVADVRAVVSTTTASSAAPQSEDRPWLRTFKYSIPRGFPNTSGSIRVGEVVHPNFVCRNVELLWSLRGVTPKLDRLDGEAYLRFGPGHVKDLAAAREANTFLYLVFLPFEYMHKMNSFSVFSGATAYPKSFDFDKIEGEYGAAKGVASIRYFHVAGPQFVAYAQGWADGAKETVDMNILTRLTSFRSALPEFWVDELGRPAIGFRVKGNINKPDTEPRYSKIGAQEIENDVAQGRAGAKKRFQALERRLRF